MKILLSPTILGLLLAFAALGSQKVVAETGSDLKLDRKLSLDIRHANVDGIKQTLRASPKQLYARDQLGWTPLMHAAFYADVECVQLFVEQGADVTAANQAGATALHYAATSLEKTRLLLKAGADANAVTNLGNTTLMLAVRSSSSAPIVRLLLGNRADIHARNAYGASALMIAASSDDVETVKLLLDRGADASLAPYSTPLNRDGQPLDAIFGGGHTALSWASHRGNVEIAKRLIDSGADVNGKSQFGSPLIVAAQMQRTAVAKLLLGHGADVNAAVPAGTWTPLMWAADNEYGNTELAKLLVEHGADVNSLHGSSWGPQMSSSHSAFMIAKRRGETKLVDWLRHVEAEDLQDPWARKATQSAPRSKTVQHVNTRTILTSLEAAVPLLQHTAVESVKEFVAHKQNCISCHNQLLPLIAVSTAKSRGVAHDEDVIRAMVKMLAPPGGVSNGAIAEVTFDPSPAIFGGYALWGLASESVPAYFEIDAAVHTAAVYQSADGSWFSFSPRPPIMNGSITPTALGVRALTLYPLPGRQTEMDERVVRAREWLEKSVPRTTEEHVYKLLGLFWAGCREPELLPLVKELASLQRDDGGWAQLPGLKSDAYATGQVLYALYEVGGINRSDRGFRSGIAFLLRTQLEDGSWLVRRRAYPFQPTMDAKFPHGRDAWISAAGTCWAVMALSVSLNKEDVSEALAEAAPHDSKPQITRSVELPPASNRTVDYQADIMPILETSCLDCHSSGDAAGQYALDNRASLINGGFSGPPVVIPGNSADSLLVQHVAGLIEDVEMPPLAHRDEYEPLSDGQIGLIRAWIDQGVQGLDD